MDLKPLPVMDTLIAGFVNYTIFDKGGSEFQKNILIFCINSIEWVIIKNPEWIVHQCA